MNDKNIIDVRGEACPKPLIKTKKALNDVEITDTFVVLIDNETSLQNVQRFLSDNNIDFQVSKSGDTATITVSKSGTVKVATNVEEYCEIPDKNHTRNKHIICIQSNRMGTGPDDLGEILIEGFLNAIQSVEPLPQTIIFLNSGVQLLVEGAPTVESIKELEGLGIEVLACGTCADFFNIKDKLGAGTISNMYSILETLTAADKVIYP